MHILRRYFLYSHVYAEYDFDSALLYRQCMHTEMIRSICAILFYKICLPMKKY